MLEMEYVSYTEKQNKFCIVWKEGEDYFKAEFFELSPRIVINLLLDVAEKNDTHAKQILTDNWIKMYKNRNGRFVKTRRRWCLTIKRAVWLASEIRRCHWRTCAGLGNKPRKSTPSAAILESTYTDSNSSREYSNSSYTDYDSG